MSDVEELRTEFDRVLRLKDDQIARVIREKEAAVAHATQKEAEVAKVKMEKEVEVAKVITEKDAEIAKLNQDKKDLTYQFNLVRKVAADAVKDVKSINDMMKRIFQKKKAGDVQGVNELVERGEKDMVRWTERQNKAAKVLKTFRINLEAYKDKKLAKDMDKMVLR